jgi:hypothetical protein
MVLETVVDQPRLCLQLMGFCSLNYRHLHGRHFVKAYVILFNNSAKRCAERLASLKRFAPYVFCVLWVSIGWLLGYKTCLSTLSM